MLPPNPDIACAGALTYTGIVKAVTDTKRLVDIHQNTKRLVDIHQNVNMQMDSAGNTFSCKWRYSYSQRIVILQLTKSNYSCSTHGTG